MKAKQLRENRRPPAAPVPVRSPERPSRWPYWMAALAAVIMVFWAYAPALNGPFLFDDTNLPFALPAFKAPLITWLKSDRPVLYFTYWINARMGQDDPYSFHVFNLIFHLISGGLIFLVVKRLLEWMRAEGPPRLVVKGSSPKDDLLRKDNLLAGFAAAIFLLHPVQTEAVAYLAGRSESLSAMFGLAAFAVFLYRRQRAASWRLVAAVLGLFGLALLSKQNAIALAALLLLTDFWWNPPFSLQGIRANWKLYVPMALGAVAGVGLFWKTIMTAETAGFGMKDLPWYQYFFTQCRALFVYLGMFLLPTNLTADWDFAISRTILDRGAIVGLMALLAMAWAAWHYRRRFPLAGYGFFVFLVMMAPTSSFLPIRDPIAERRLYSAILGLLLIVVDLVGRLRVDRKVLATACAVVVLLAAGATYARAGVWSDAIVLWEDTARKAPHKQRVLFQLGYSYFSANPPQYARAVAEFEKALQLGHPDYNLLIDSALAYDAVGRMDDALAKLREAALMEPTAHVYTQIAVVYATRDRWAEALDALATAEKIDPRFAYTYVYRGNVFLKTNRCADALREYQHALALEPGNDEAIRMLPTALQCVQSVPH